MSVVHNRRKSADWLQMGPIYWDPIHDVCSVVRGTWFYKDTMMPVETDVANQIEEGYEYMKPWTSTYVDELNSCLEIGAEAELKVVYRLWPVDDSSSDVRPATAKSKMSLLQTATRKLQPDERARKHAIMAAENPQNRAAGVFDGRDDPIRLYAKSSLIYANARDAQILRPSQLPSIARGRRPLGAIRKGRAVGIPIVRGFDYKAWDRLHPPSRKATTVAKARDGLDTVWTATSMAERDKSCGACSAEEERPKATDLVLVIHGQVLYVLLGLCRFSDSVNGTVSGRNCPRGLRAFISLTPSMLSDDRLMWSWKPKPSNLGCVQI